MRYRNGTTPTRFTSAPVLLAFAVALALSTTGVALGHVGGGKDHEHPPCDAKSVTEKVRTGSGVNTYESVPNWCQIPADRGGKLGATHGNIVVDKAGLIYFSMDAGPHGILVYSPDGKYQKGIVDGVNGIHGMAINEEGGEEFIYCAHLAGKRLMKVKLDGTVVWTIDGAPKESGKYDDPGRYNPTAVAVGPDGSVFVADGYGTQWLHKFDKDRKYVKSFGGPGGGPGQFQTCHGMGLDTRGEKPLLLICDRENKRLQHFDLDGNFVAVVTQHLRRPCTVSFLGERVAVAELEGRVTILDKTNTPVAFLGDNPKRDQWANFGVPPEAWRVGIFTAPHGVSFDKDGNVYVMDWNASGRVSRLDQVKEFARVE